MIGTTLLHYRILEKLGAGGQGTVYKALNTKLNRPVVIKVLPPELTIREANLKRFEREARLASALDHPNICTIFDFNEVGGVNFIVMQYVEGRNVRQLVKGHPLELQSALSIAIQVADALAAAHARGIIHRDIKAGNVMVTNPGHVKVLDFGLAKLSDEALAQADGIHQTQLTEIGVPYGTATYAAPEQASGDRVDKRADIFSTGVLLYEMLTGTWPFHGKTSIDVRHAVLHDTPQPVAEFRTDVLPPSLQQILDRALAKEPRDRYQRIEDLRDELKNVLCEISTESDSRQLMEGVGTFAPRRAASTGAVARGLRWLRNLGTIIAPAVSPGGTDQPVVEIVKEQSARTGEVQVAYPTSSAEYLVSEIKRHKRGVIVAVVAVALAALIAVVANISYFGRGDKSVINSTLSAVPQGMKIARLTSTGRASHAAISPDGRYVVYVAIENGQESLRVRQVNTTSEVQIAASADVQYTGLTFSRDGDFIYYVVSKKNSPTNLLYQIPVLGGTPRELIEDVGSAITLSPDGQQLAFIRYFPSQGKQALVIVKADGTNERKLAARKLPNFLKSVSWSPNGKGLACAAGSLVPSYNSYVVEVSLETGKEKPISSQEWLFMGQVAWLADGSGLILDASEQGSPSFDSNQIWYVSYPGGEARRLTTGFNNYTSVSLTADSSRLVAVQSETAANIWVVPLGDARRATQITRGVGQRDGWNGLAWTTDGKIIYASQASGNDDLWIMSQDGSNQRQLTANAHMNAQPAVSQDGRYFVFSSDRAGTSNIWRMDAEGSNSKQLTSGSGENLAQCSPDGKWVLYTLVGAGKPTLWRVSMNGGAPQQLTDRFTSSPVISPDGKLVACFYREVQPNSASKIALLPFEGGEPIKLFDVSTSIGRLLRWTPDGRALTYIITASGISDVWSQPIDGGAPKQLTNFKVDQIFWFDWSRDGKQLAVARGSVASDVVLISSFR